MSSAVPQAPRQGALMVCGTGSDAGKSLLVAGLCRLLARNGVRVAPFKAQNMSLNSAVTVDGHEIGRAQYLQAQAAGIEAEVAMNPILLKPTGETTCQVVLNGFALGEQTAADYHRAKTDLLPVVLATLQELRGRFDVVILEGAGSPTEINLLERDLVNLPLAAAAGVAAIVVGDIDRGGVFAALHGTVELLPDELRACVGGFVINKLRGDPALLGDGPQRLEQACGVPTLGVLPMLRDLDLDAEDSLLLSRGGWAPADDASLDVAVLAVPHLANATDIDPLAADERCSVRLVTRPAQLGTPHLLILPGSKHTVGDLAWLRSRGFTAAIERLAASGRTTVLGLCAGFQMLGRRIDDDVESRSGTAAGLGLLPVRTTFEATKVLAQGRGVALDQPLHGYQIHHGRVRLDPDAAAEPAEAWLTFAGRPDGIRAGTVWGTTVHGLFEADGFRNAFLETVAAGAGLCLGPSSLRMAERRQANLDRVADAIEAHVDLDRVWALVRSARPPEADPPSAPARRGVPSRRAPHGGDGRRVAAELGLDPASIIDLSASLNPFAPDVAVLAAARLHTDPDVLRSYPDATAATGSLAAALEVDPELLVLTNGGAEAIALVASTMAAGSVQDPEFSLYRRHLAEVRADAPRWRSNPSNPLGRLAGPGERAAVWDEAFYPLATGRWTRGDGDVWRLGSLTKLWACPGLRLGFAVAADRAQAEALRERQARWPINGLALALMDELLDRTDLHGWQQAIAALRGRFRDELVAVGHTVTDSDVNWVLVDGDGLRDRLAPSGVIIRDLANFGLRGRYRVALPPPSRLDRVVAAFASVAP